jgi:HSP20 family protein
MESWLEQMSDQFETAAESWGSGVEMGEGSLGQLRIDFVEADEEYVVVANVPGFSKENVDVYVTDQTLAIDAERSDAAELTEGTFITNERTHESVSRRLTLPNDADTDDVTATMDEGVLTVRLGRTEPLDSGHRIDID